MEIGDSTKLPSQDADKDKQEKDEKQSETKVEAPA